MTRKVTDQRGVHTRATLQRALKSLLRTKPYERISVDEICVAANVGRSTFYTHFRSKDDLKRSGLEKLRRQLLNRQASGRSNSKVGRDATLSFTQELFEHAHDHLEHYRSLAGSRGGAVVLRKLKDTMTDLVRADLTRTQPRSLDAGEREAAVQCVVGAFMAVLTWWLDRGATIPVERINGMFQRFAREGIYR
jgi:AcrR family transcriptional regulator